MFYEWGERFPQLTECGITLEHGKTACEQLLDIGIFWNGFKGNGPKKSGQNRK